MLWLCSTKLFENKIKKDRKKLIKQKRKNGTLLPKDCPINASQHSISYQYQGSPLGMGVHPMEPPIVNHQDSLNSSLAGSLFNQSIISEGSRSLASAYSIDNDTRSLNGVHVLTTDNSDNQSLNESMESNKYSFVNVKVSDTSTLALNKEEVDAFSRLLTNSKSSQESKSSTKSIQTKKPPIVKLHLFHPKPNQFKKYKSSLKHVNSTIHIALVKGHFYIFIPFLILVSWCYSGGGMLWLSQCFFVYHICI